MQIMDVATFPEIPRKQLEGVCEITWLFCQQNDQVSNFTHRPYLNQHRWTGREDQGGRDNCAEGTRQIDPVTSGEGGPCFLTKLMTKEVELLKVTWHHHETMVSSRVSQNRGWRLFNKNTGLSKVATRRIGSDACPVLATKGEGWRHCWQDIIDHE